MSKVVERLGHVGDPLHHLRELRLEDPGAELLLELVWVPPPDRLTDGALDGCRVLALSGGRIKIKWTSTIQTRDQLSLIFMSIPSALRLIDFQNQAVLKIFANLSVCEDFILQSNFKCHSFNRRCECE